MWGVGYTSVYWAGLILERLSASFHPACRFLIFQSHVSWIGLGSSGTFNVHILLLTEMKTILQSRNVAEFRQNSLSQQHFCFFPILKVSEGSEVRFQSANFSLHCQIQKESLPHGNEHLLNWAQKKYKAVTSFSELRTTQDIYIKVGEGVYRFPKFPT